jgi:lipopolysaccharide transport system permease protein
MIKTGERELPSTVPSPINQKKADHSIIIQPSTGWSALHLSELWEYRDLLYFMVWRDLKARYRQTALGPTWIILEPLVSMALYTLVFGVIAKLPSDGVPYTIFAYVGLLPWSFFSDSVAAGVGGLEQNKSLIAKVYFPRLIPPLAKIMGNAVDLLVSFGILILMLIYYGIQPSWGVVFIPLFLLVAAATGLGFGLFFAGFIVKYRDVGNFVSYTMRALMYAAPVVYSSSLVPERFRFWYNLNPMTGVVEGFRWALVGTVEPNWVAFLISCVVAIVMLLAGMFVFRRAERNIVDIA